MAEHKDLTDANMHEPLGIQSAIAAEDAGKVIVAKGDGTSELRFLKSEDIEGGAAQQVVVIQSESDFPDPVTGPDGVSRIPLARDTCYIIDAAPDSTFVLTTPFWIPDTTGSFLRATTIESACNVIVSYTGTDCLFYGPQISFVSFRRIVWVAATPGTCLFDLQGSVDPGTISVMETVTSSFLGFDMGRIINVGASKLDFVAVLHTNPLRIHNSDVLVTLDDMTFNTNTYGATGEPCLVLSGDLQNVALHNLRPQLLATDSFLAVDAGVSATTQVDIQDTAFAAGAAWNFFQPVVNGSLTQMQDLGTLISGNATNYEQTANGQVKVTHDSVTPMGVGTQVTHSGTSNYNGTHRIVAILSTTEYIMDATYVADEVVGSFVGAGTRITVSGTHILDEFRTIVIAGTTNYNGTHTVYNTTTNAFDIDTAFVADDATGTYSMTSLDQTHPNVTGFNNGALDASAKEAILQWNGNTDLTAVVDGTYIATDLGGVTETFERFESVDAQEGEVRCKSKEGFRGVLTAVMTATKTGGGGSSFRFAIGINGAVPVFASAPYLAVEIVASAVTVPLVFPVNLNENDTVQIFVAGDGTGDDLTISDGYIIYRE